MSAIKKYDSVDCILDKIDAELSLLKPLELPGFLRTPGKSSDALGATQNSNVVGSVTQSNGGGGGGGSGSDGSSWPSLQHGGGKAADAAPKKTGRALEPLADSDASQSDFSLTELASSQEGDVESLVDLAEIQHDRTLIESAADGLNSTRTDEFGYDTETELKAELAKESSRIQKEIQQERAARGATAIAAAAAAAAMAAMTQHPGHRSASASPVRPTTCSSRITEEPEGLDDELSDDAGGDDDGGDDDGGNDKESIEQNEDDEACDMDIARSILEETLCSIREAKQEKLLLLLEVNGLQDNVDELEGTLEQLEKLTMDNRARADEARSQLALVECQKSNLLKDLEKLNAEIELKQDVLSKASSRKRMFGSEHSKCEGSGSGGEQSSHLLELLEEKNQLISTLEQQSRSVQRERDELEKCLALVNDELIGERKKSRMRVDTAEDEMESLLHKLDESNSALEELGLRLRASEAKVQQLQEEKIQCILERTRECEELKGQSQRDLLEVKAYSATELAGMAARQKLDEDKIAKLQDELVRRDQAAAEARSQIMVLQQTITERDKEKDAVAKDWAQKLEDAMRNKASEIKSLKEVAEREQQQQKRTLQAHMSAEAESLLQSIKREHMDQMLHLQQSVAGREEEIQLLKESLKAQEESMQRTVAAVQADARQKRDEVVRREREMWEQERQYLSQQQMAHYKEELCKHMEKLKEQYESERALVQQLQHKNRALAAELDDIRQANVRMSQDYQRKLTSASKSKKAIQKELARELEAAKIDWDEEKLTEMKKLADALEEKDGIIQSLESAQRSAAQREAELEGLVDKCEHTVVQEINDDCRKTALVLGVAPRKATAASAGTRSNGSSPSSRRSLARSAITSALANLRACNDELRSHVKEVSTAGDSVRMQLQELQQKQSTEIEKLKTRLQREKVREQLAKDEAKRENGTYANGVDASLLHRGCSDWNEDDIALYDPDVPELVIPERTIPERYGPPLAKQQLQMNVKRQDKQYDSRTGSLRRQPLKNHASPSKASLAATANGFDEPLTTVAMLRKLQERVKHVCSSTGGAPAGSTGGSSNVSSMSDLSNLSDALNGCSAGLQQGAADDLSRSLEQRVKAAELQAQLAEDRGGRRYDHLLGQRLHRKDLGDFDRSQSRSTRLSSLSLSNL